MASIGINTPMLPPKYSCIFESKFEPGSPPKGEPLPKSPAKGFCPLLFWLLPVNELKALPSPDKGLLSFSGSFLLLLFPVKVPIAFPIPPSGPSFAASLLLLFPVREPMALPIPDNGLSFAALSLP